MSKNIVQSNWSNKHESFDGETPDSEANVVVRKCKSVEQQEECGWVWVNIGEHQIKAWLQAEDSGGGGWVQFRPNGPYYLVDNYNYITEADEG